MRLVICGRHYGAEEPFLDMFDSHVYAFRHEGPVELTSDDVVLFGGGEDIAPVIYKQKPSRYCRIDGPSGRDVFEVFMFDQATKVGAKMLGICRGAQLICAMSGGSLVQHVTHHAGHNHPMETSDGRVIEVCSVHHQMMNPFNTKHELIGWAKDKISTCYIVGGDKTIEVDVEPEIVYFPETKALGIQYHPEFMASKDEAVQYARELVTKYLL